VVKTLIVGDVHGCYAEFMDLLNLAALGVDDEIIALGDLVDRGPDSLSVLKFFRQHPRARSIMGNHERKHLLSFRQSILPAQSQLLAQQQIPPDFYAEAINLIADFPLFIELSEAILIHGCLEPEVTITQQREAVLTGAMSGEEYLRRKYQQPWYELYDKEKPIIAGHRDYSKEGKPTIYGDKAFLIDTGCCYGRYLTGLILPDFKIIAVKSRKDYWSQARQSYRRGKT
jgi:serine/threonine protein phosphatase 1